jgi:hypothetical protein
MTPYAAEVRRAIVSALPELAAALTETPSGDLLLSVPHPRIPTGLRATTAGDDFTVGFGAWHTHADVEGGIPNMVALIARILSDKTTLVVSEEHGRFVDAWVTDDPEAERRFQAPGETLRIGSWSELAR